MAVAKVNVTVGVGAAILMLIIDDPTFQQKSSAFGGYSWNAAAGRKAGNWGVSPKSPMSSGKVG